MTRTDFIKAMPYEPTGFNKANSGLTGHNAGVVRSRDVTMLDCEPELVFVIGEPTCRVQKSSQIAAVFEFGKTDGTPRQCLI